MTDNTNKQRQATNNDMGTLAEDARKEVRVSGGSQRQHGHVVETSQLLEDVKVSSRWTNLGRHGRRRRDVQNSTRQTRRDAVRHGPTLSFDTRSWGRIAHVGMALAATIADLIELSNCFTTTDQSNRAA